VAKLFGYADQAPAPAKVNAVQGQSVQAEPKIEERTQSMPGIRKPPNQSVRLAKAQISMNDEQQVVQSSAVQEKAKVPKVRKTSYQRAYCIDKYVC
jgi:hypothetical protein